MDMIEQFSLGTPKYRIISLLILRAEGRILSKNEKRNDV